MVHILSRWHELSVFAAIGPTAESSGDLMAQRRRRRHLLLGLVGVLGAMRLMAERMEVGFAGWKMDQMGLGPGALLRLRRTEASEIQGKLKQIWCKLLYLSISN